jgi:hypothetical protein
MKGAQGLIPAMPNEQPHKKFFVYNDKIFH